MRPEDIRSGSKFRTVQCGKCWLHQMTATASVTYASSVMCDLAAGGGVLDD